jgi:hypothetical protein
MTKDALLYIQRILRLLAEHGIVDVDMLKHQLEDHDRWRGDIFIGRLVELHPNGILPDSDPLRVTALTDAFFALAVKTSALEAIRQLARLVAQHEQTIVTLRSKEVQH